jgi:hypothetical protein
MTWEVRWASLLDVSYRQCANIAGTAAVDVDGITFDENEEECL